MAKRARREPAQGKIRYEFAPGSRIGSKKEAQLVGEYLAALAGPRQVITPVEVLEAAQSPGSPLHRYFTWDDSKAAQQWRINEARQVLRSIVVCRIEGDQVSKSRDWLSVADDDQQVAYVRSEFVWQTPSLADRVIEQARGQMEDWVRRYQDYEQIREAVSAGRTVLARLARAEKRRA